MKYIFILLLLGTIRLHAQPPRRDTIHFGQWRQEITRAPVLTGQSQPIIIVPNRGEFCFDKQINLKMSIGRASIEQTAYLDTHNGLVGILPPYRGGAVQDIMPELEHFNFTVTSLKGNIYIYKNHKDKNGIAHEVSTGNTQQFAYQSPAASNPGSGVGMARKAESRAYCDNKITAQSYRYDGGMSTWFVYGDRYPEKLHPRKFLGAFGVGYIFCDEGLYLVMELDFGNNSTRIGDIQNVHNCFNPAEFQLMEEKFQANQQQELAENNAKVDREQSKLSGDCIAEKQAVLDFKKELNQKQQELLRKSQHGNTYQDTITQRAFIGMMDPLDNARLGVLTAKQSICGAQTDMVKNPRNAENDRVKINCLNDQISRLLDIESKMQAAESRYASNPARAQAEKSKIYWDGTKNMQPCN